MFDDVYNCAILVEITLGRVDKTMARATAQCSGVYQIRCVPNGKIYIGSTIDIATRWVRHQNQLKNGSHPNMYLQSAWNKYGAENFELSILEVVTRENLLIAEQRWLDSTQCTNREIGFNIFDIAGSPGDAFVQTWEGFVDPKGNEVTITNLFDFCRENDIDWASMHRLAMGKSKLKSYKGWTHRNSVRQREFVKIHEGFIDPEGTPVAPIKNLAEFCRQHGLDDTHMIAVATGRICSHKGWTHVNGRSRQDQKTYTQFVNPQGEKVVITNLSQFCRENGLHPVKMHQVKSGKIRQYKGWTWSHTDE